MRIILYCPSAGYCICFREKKYKKKTGSMGNERERERKTKSEFSGRN